MVSLTRQTIGRQHAERCERAARNAERDGDWSTAQEWWDEAGRWDAWSQGFDVLSADDGD